MPRMLSFLLCCYLLGFQIVWATDHGPSTVRFSTAIISPYQMYSQTGELEGFAIPIIDCAMQSMGLNYKVDVLPWARAQKNVEIGQSDAFFVASQNATRDAFAKQSYPLFSGTRSWFFLKESVADPLSDEFRAKAMVGTIFGTNMHRLLAENYQNVVTKTTEEELITLLRLGRLNGLFLTDLMFDHTLAKLNLDSSAFVRKASVTKPLGVYFGKHFLAQNPSFLDGFDQAVVSCKDTL